MELAVSMLVFFTVGIWGDADTFETEGAAGVAARRRAAAATKSGEPRPYLACEYATFSAGFASFNGLGGRLNSANAAAATALLTSRMTASSAGYQR